VTISKSLLSLIPDDRFILNASGVHRNCHESPWFIPLLEDIPIPLHDICDDKDFDSEKNQRYVSGRM